MNSSEEERMFESGWSAFARCAAWASVVLALCAPQLAAAQSQVTAKGDTIRGRIADLTSKGVYFEPAAADAKSPNTILVRWKDVEAIESEGPYTVLYGEEGEARGRILGIEGQLLLVGDDPASAQRVETADLFRAFDESKATGSWVERLRSRLRFWTATLDAGAAYTEATTDSVLGTAGFLIDRKKSPTHFFLEGAARYATEDKQHEKRSITENMLYLLGRGEYDFTERIYTYASTRATHDNEQHLSLRLEPRKGAGYHFIKSEDHNFSADVGVGWVYENYFGDEGTFPFEVSRGSDDYWAIAFGAQADSKLPYGMLWRARAEYLPAVDDWMHDYLARAETSLDIPMLEWLAFRLTFADEYDNTPADGAQRNKFVTTAGLALSFVP
jgi:putative salt-induced outer membrane protein YdiY